jgi:hypothetical protein
MPWKITHPKPPATSAAAEFSVNGAGLRFAAFLNFDGDYPTPFLAVVTHPSGFSNVGMQLTVPTKPPQQRTVIFSLKALNEGFEKPFTLNVYHFAKIDPPEISPIPDFTVKLKLKTPTFIGIDFDGALPSDFPQNSVQAYGPVTAPDIKAVKVTISKGATTTEANYIFNDYEGFWYASFPTVETTGGGHSFYVEGDANGHNTRPNITIT